ncbi:TM2 domain-containing protein [Bergeyella cardium]|uniref:NINE protein n=1 Tax=Bergeyella cardium TaxID=1585976 RepID=A0A6P1QU71_9FLAO|nr:TM2 domain-containing protein [Bergeyella cardium]QHN65349.1 NINE protein [Bergeyella cardium]WHE32926.1 TM2 domain-containing protein [Bergeyella cardium]WHF59578.1 TM2 domain-containing protein [Bergeyella cardium]
MSEQNLTNGQESKRVVAGVLAILLGYLGVHKFYLGYKKEGIIQLVVGLITCGASGIVSIIEGVIYLMKSDEEFVETYQVNQKPWF